MQNEKTTMFPLQEQAKSAFRAFRNKFRCLKENDMQIWGSYDSEKAQQLAISFKMCEGADYCESEENIREWLRHKYIVLLYN